MTTQAATQRHQPSPDELQEAVRKVISKSNIATPLTAKQVSVAISDSNPSWDVPERRVAKFIKKEGGKKRFKFASPFAKKEKTEKVKADIAALEPEAAKVAATRIADAATEKIDAIKAPLETKVKEMTAGVYSNDNDNAGPEPCCNSCNIS